MEDPIKIPFFLWVKLNKELRAHSSNIRESGAFLLSNLNSSKVCLYILYHELDPDSSNQGFIHFKSEGYTRLWEICKRKRLKVIADVHTHPGRNINQSELDMKHPMIFLKNHVALIIPFFARKKILTLSSVGIYEYLGDFNWKKYPINSKRVVITII